MVAATVAVAIVKAVRVSVLVKVAVAVDEAVFVTVTLMLAVFQTMEVLKAEGTRVFAMMPKPCGRTMCVVEVMT